MKKHNVESYGFLRWIRRTGTINSCSIKVDTFSLKIYRIDGSTSPVKIMDPPLVSLYDIYLGLLHNSVNICVECAGNSKHFCVTSKSLIEF